MVRTSCDIKLLSVLIFRQEHSPLIEIDTGHHINVIAFTPNGEYLAGGGDEGVQVWRVKDGKQVATMRVECDGVYCVAVSKDSMWIAAGSFDGQVLVWDAATYELILAHKTKKYAIADVDFSPDSTRLVTASSNGTVIIWDIPARRQLRTIDYDGWLVAAKYSPQGDRIATASETHVRVLDGSGQRVLNEIEVGVIPWPRGLIWSDNHLFVVTNHNKIKRIVASVEPTISEWLVPHTDTSSCLALPRHGKFIAYSSRDTITFWSTSRHTQLDLILHYNYIYSIAFSPDDQLLAIAAEKRKIVIKRLSFVTVRFMSYLSSITYLHMNKSPLILHTSHSRNQKSLLMALRSIHGKMDNLQMQKHY